jgi:hypothetical protein
MFLEHPLQDLFPQIILLIILSPVVILILILRGIEREGGNIPATPHFPEHIR